MEFYSYDSLFSLFLFTLSQYKMYAGIDLDEFERQVAIYQAAIDQIQLVREFVDGKEIRHRIDLPMNFFENHYNALVNASEYIQNVDRKLRSHGLEKEYEWDGYYNDICSHRMICNIFENFWRWDIDEVDRFENLVDALENRDRRIRDIQNALLYNYNIVTPQYHAKVRELIVQQALEILNYYRPSLTFARLIGLSDSITLSDDRLIELASEIAKVESDKVEFASWHDDKLDSSEEDADYLAAEMGEEPPVSTKKVSKGRRHCKKVKGCL